MTPLIQRYVTLCAERQPDRAAVVSDEATLTYGQLDRRSTQLARVLREAGCRQHDRVCVLAPKSAAAIVAILGIYKADAIYVPLDPASPARRLSKIVASADPSWVLAGGRAGPLVDHLLDERPLATPPGIGWLEAAPSGARFRSAFDLRDVASAPDAPVPTSNREHDPAHILFTSGSTGTPKGVVITHANVRRFVDWGVRYFAMTPADRQSCHSPLCFDLSVFDIFGTLAAGAALYLVPAELNMLPDQLAEFIRTRALTQWFSVPSLLTFMATLDVVRQGDFPQLKRLLWCGEVLPTRTLRHWMTRLPHVRFTNLYGPTEATIASSYFTVPVCPRSDRDVVPIGRPCAGEELHVLDHELRPVPPGIVGDLYISGAGLSPGYWRNLEATRAAFRPNPFSSDPASRMYRTGDLASVDANGVVYFHGRADTQVKSRGYRIELGEIEAALHTLGDLDDCAVVAVPSEGFEGVTLCCAYVPASGRAPTPAALRRQLAALVPAYMIPTRWQAFAVLPTNGNGKVDRPLLKTEFSRRAPDSSLYSAAR